MSKEVKTETTWWGGEKQVAYEDGQRTGEVKHEQSFLHQITGGALGSEKDVAYDNSGNRVSQTTYEPSLLNQLSGGLIGTNKSVTRDLSGNVLSETRHGQGLLGNRNDIYENGEKIGEIKRERGFFGGRKKVIHESRGKNVDVLRRTTRKESIQTSRSYSSSDSGQTNSSQEESELEKKAQQEHDRIFHVHKFTTQEDIKAAINSGHYTGVYWEPSTFMLKYKCDKCGSEFIDTHNTHGCIPDRIDCRAGCSYGNNGSFIGLVKTFISLFTGKPPFGYGRLISQKEL